MAELAARLRGAVPTLEADRTRLRAMRIEDFPAWAEILCSDRARWMDGPYTRDTAFVEFEATAGAWPLRGHGGWTVEDRATGEVLGFVCLNMEPSDRETELGFFFREAAEGRGVAFEAASAARDWAWSMALPSLVSYVDPANARSARLARRGHGRVPPPPPRGPAHAPGRPRSPHGGRAMSRMDPPLDPAAKAAQLLREHRESIDRLDAILVFTLAERFKHTQAVGRLKAAHGLPPSDPTREGQQIARLVELSEKADLDPEFAQKFLAFIIQEVIKHHETHQT
jgi:chorismate mutase